MRSAKAAKLRIPIATLLKSAAAKRRAIARMNLPIRIGTFEIDTFDIRKC
jgi:hypothetical protein